MKPRTPRFRPIASALFRLRPLLAILLTVAALSYLTPLAATALIGQETLRLHAQRALLSAAGRDVILEGPVRLTMFPWLGLQAGPVTMPNAPGFGPQPLARVQSVTIGLNLWALVQKKILVQSIAMREPSLELNRDTQGRENWLAAALAAPVASADESATGWKVDSLPYGLQMANASLTYTDARTDTQFTVRHLNLLTGSGKTFNFSLSCEVTANPLDIVAEIHAKGQASYGETGEYIFVHGAEVAGAIGKTAAQTRPQIDPQARFSAMVLFHGQGGALEVSNLLLEGLDARVTGQINIAGLYDATPTLWGALSASAKRNGPWREVLGLAPIHLNHWPVFTTPEPVQESMTPVLRSPAPPSRIEAKLEFGATPDGWKLDTFVLHDGPGKLTAEASWFNQDLRFDILANDFDLDAWIPRGGAKLPLLPVWPRPGWAVHGKVSAKDVRLGGQDIAELLLSAQGEQGALRLYPFTIRASECLTAADLRLQPTTAGASFTGKTSLVPLPHFGNAQPHSAAPSDAATALVKTAEASLTGEITTSGAAGTLQLRMDDLPPNWQPPQLSQGWIKTLRTLGGLSAKSGFRVYAPQGLPDEAWNAWEATGLEIKTHTGSISGSMRGDADKTVVDLAADRLELDKLSALAPLSHESSGGLSLRPLEGRVAVRKFAAWGLEFDDVLLSGQVSPQSLRISTLSAQLAGGKISGGFDMENKAGRRSASLTLSGSGVQAGPLSSALLPGGTRLTGSLEGRASLEASEPIGQPLWRNARAQAELQLGSGSIAFGLVQAKPASGFGWPVNRAVLGLKFTNRAAAQGNEAQRESVLVDVTGSLRLDMPGAVRQSQIDLHGQAGLDSSGRPLWYRQSQAEGSFTFVLPFSQPVRLANCLWKGKFETDLERGGFSLADVELNAAGLPARLRLNGSPGPSPQSPLSFSGVLDIPEFSPRDAAARQGITVPRLADPLAWRRARLSTELGGTLKDMHFNHITLGLDDAVLTGQASVTDGKIHAGLAVNVLDLDRLFPAEDIQDPSRRAEQTVPMDLLRDTALDAKLHAGKLIKSRLVWGNTLMEANILGGRFSYRQQAEDFYGGRFSLDVKGDARGPELKAQAAMRVSGTSGVELLKDLSGGSALTKGVLEFELNGASTGNTDKKLVRRLAGTARFDLTNGGMVFRDSNTKPQQSAPSSQQPAVERDPMQPKPAHATAQGTDAMPFGHMGAGFSIHEGVGTTTDFMFTGPVVSAKGSGMVSLVDETILLNLTASVRDVGDLPVRIHGALYDPQLDIDRSGILADTLVNIIKGVVNIPANLLNQLRRLF